MATEENDMENDMKNDALYHMLKQLPKELLHYYILELMHENLISFPELATLHSQYLEKLRKGETKELMDLRGKIISIWCDKKKNFGKNLVKLIQEGKDKGWANINQECIDESIWNK